MLDIFTVAFWIFTLIAVVNPIYMAWKCRSECSSWSYNFYLKNHTRPSAYFGIHINTIKGVKQTEEEMLIVEKTTFTLGFFYFYWQFTFETILDAK